MFKTLMISALGAVVFFTSIAIASMTKPSDSVPLNPAVHAPSVDAGYAEHISSVSRINIYRVKDAGALVCGDQ